MTQHLRENRVSVSGESMMTNKNIYGSADELYRIRKAAEEMGKKLDEEKRKEKPDRMKMNKIREAMLMPGLFSDVMGYNDRFRNPW